jgi:hypothetical protein
MMKKQLPLLALLLLAFQILSAYNISQEGIKSIQANPADIWSDRGGEGPNVTCGYAKVGENVTFFFRVSSLTYLRIVIVRPDGSEVEVMKSSQVFPGITYKFHQLFIDPGMRVIKLIGYSGNVLDYCTMHVVTSSIGGDVWTEAGGRGPQIDGGTLIAGNPVRILFSVNVTSEVQLFLYGPEGKGEPLFSGRLEGGKTKAILLEGLREGKYTLKLLQGNKILDSCSFSVIKPVQRVPPSIRISSIDVNGSIVSINGEALPGTPNASLVISWDWGDGSYEEGPFPRTHKYEREGKYTIRIVARQSDGLSANFTYSIFITPATPTEVAEESVASEVKAMNVTKEETVTIVEEKTPSELIAFILGALISALIITAISRILRRA